MGSGGGGVCVGCNNHCITNDTCRQSAHRSECSSVCSVAGCKIDIAYHIFTILFTGLSFSLTESSK